MRTLTNNINLSLIFLFIIAPFAGYFLRVTINSEFDYIITLLSIIAVIALLLFRAQLFFPKYLIFLLIYSVFIIISDLFIAGKEFSFKYIYSNDILSSFLVIFIIENTYFSKRFMDNSLKTSTVILVIAFIVILIQQFVNMVFFVSPSEAQDLLGTMFTETRLPSIYSWIGGLFIMGLCFFPVLAIVLGDALKFDKKFIILLYIMGAIVAFISKSRFIMLNYIFILFLIPLYQKIDLVKIVKFISIIVIVCGVTYVGAKQIGFDIDNIINERILETKSQDVRHSTAGTRLLAIDVFKKLFPENSLFGKGRLHYGLVGSKDYELVRELQGRSSQIHVGYLSLFYYYGIVGGGLFLAFTIAVLIHMHKTAKRTWMWGPFFGFAQLVIYNLTGVILNFIAMGIVICFVFDKYYRDMNEEMEVEMV